jgi:predicted nucleic acid-binding protein
MIYFDTAYLLKCYVKEAGWQEVRALARQHDGVACSAYGKLELHAALHRKLRGREITRAQLRTVFDQLELDEAQRLWTWLPLTEFIMASVVSSFRTLPGHVFLRTADAVHLVTAKSHAFREVYSTDIHLLAAAPNFGLQGKNIIDPL